MSDDRQLWSTTENKFGESAKNIKAAANGELGVVQFCKWVIIEVTLTVRGNVGVPDAMSQIFENGFGYFYRVFCPTT